MRAVFLGLVFAVACSSFDGEDPPPAAPPSAEAGAPEPSDSGAPDSPDGPLATPWTPCSLRRLAAGSFCDDFDRGGLVNSGWNQSGTSPGGSIEFIEAGLSAPRAFVGRIAADVGGPSRAQLGFQVAEMPRQSYLATFWFRLDQLPHANRLDGRAQFYVVRFDDATCNTHPQGGAVRTITLTLGGDGKVRVVLRGMTPCGSDGAPLLEADLPYTPSELADGAFHQAAVEIGHRPCPSSVEPATVRVAIDGTEKLCAGLPEDPLDFSSTLTTSFGPGISEGPNAATAFVYDNITLEHE